MKLLIDVEKESVEELKKAINVLSKIVDNKRNNRPVMEGVSEAKISSEPSSVKATSDSRQARRVEIQEQMMKEINLSKMLCKR